MHDAIVCAFNRTPKSKGTYEQIKKIVKARWSYSGHQVRRSFLAMEQSEIIKTERTNIWKLSDSK